MHEFYLWKREAEDSVDKAVTRLAQCARDGVLHIVTDEMAPDSFHPKRSVSPSCLSGTISSFSDLHGAC